nr:probable disease resistance protein At5g47260 [Ziziphus jujuba var. spinosa]
MAACLEHLYSIKISECKKMEEVIISRIQNMEKLSFSKLRHLHLRNLPSLVRFSSEIFIEFPVLNELSIQDCPQFGTFVSKSEQNSSTAIPSLFNQKLTELSIEGCSKFVTSISISEDNLCTTVSSFFNKFVSFPVLENLKLSGCHFTKIWDDQLLPSSLSLHNLKILTLDKCNFLKNLFTSTIASSLEGLHGLNIRDCKMEEIISNNEMMKKVSFPDLEYLELENLPNLASFSSAIFLEFPVLKRLSINDCPELKGFISMLEENFSIPMPPLFNEKVRCFMHFFFVFRLINRFSIYLPLLDLSFCLVYILF